MIWWESLPLPFPPLFLPSGHTSVAPHAGIDVHALQKAAQEECWGQMDHTCAANGLINEQNETMPHTGLHWLNKPALVRATQSGVLPLLVAPVFSDNIGDVIGQVRYALGDSGFSYVVGYGDKYPRQPQVQSASCQPAPATCNQVSAHPPPQGMGILPLEGRKEGRFAHPWQPARLIGWNNVEVPLAICRSKHLWKLMIHKSVSSELRREEAWLSCPECCQGRRLPHSESFSDVMA